MGELVIKAASSKRRGEILLPRADQTHLELFYSIITNSDGTHVAPSKYVAKRYADTG